MIYTPETKRAMKLCYRAHQGQTDRNGLPYVFHPFHLAEEMADEVSTAAALLHDVVEDTPCTLDELREMGFSREVVETVALLTHEEGTPYLEYVSRIRKSGNPAAMAVKRADLRHNGDPSRLEEVTAKDERRFLKYDMARAVLAQDDYDPARGLWCKSIPLNRPHTHFMNVWYDGDGIARSYGVDVEEVPLERFAFDVEQAERLRKQLPYAESLPEALARFLEAEGADGLAAFLRANGIPGIPAAGA